MSPSKSSMTMEDHSVRRVPRATLGDVDHFLVLVSDLTIRDFSDVEWTVASFEADSIIQ